MNEPKTKSPEDHLIYLLQAALALTLCGFCVLWLGRGCVDLVAYAADKLG